MQQLAQSKNSNEIDSVLVILKQSNSEKQHLDAYVELAGMYRHINTLTAQTYADSAIHLAKKLKEYKTLWLGLNSKAEALRISGNLEEAMKIHHIALELAEANHLKTKTAHSLNNIGLVLKRQSNFKAASEYIAKAKEIYLALRDSAGMITAYNNLGNCYYSISEYDKAIAQYKEAVLIAEAQKNYYSLGNAYTNMAHCYYEQKQKAKAKEYYFTGMQYREKNGNASDLADSYGNYGYMLAEEGKYSEADAYYQKALIINKTAGNKDRLRHVYGYIAELAILKKDYKTAYYYADSARVLKDSIVNESNVQSLNEMSERFDSEKKQLQIENLAKENILKEQENKQQKLFLIIIGLALVVAIVLGVYAHKQYQQKHKANKIITKQKEFIEEKQKEILDSITYAKRLQEAILPPNSLIKQHLPKSFVLYKPKAIVAGDFYWLHVSPNENTIFIAAADCTGHGVPGAMVSVVCSNALHRAVNEFNLTETGEILDKTRELVLETFAKGDNDVKDGMDISLCCINKTTKLISWSGAYNPLWSIHNNQLNEITANKQPIGKTENPRPFKTHQLSIEKGTVLYLFTDGFADQFGGENGKKFKYKALKELLISVSKHPIHEQEQLLESAFNSWKGSLEQVDDVCLIGIEV